MNQNKTLMSLAVASIALLLIACCGFFWVAWSSMSNAEKLREENHRLALESTVCSLRLANTTGGASYNVPEAKPDVPVVAPESIPAVPKTVRKQTFKTPVVRADKTESAKAMKSEPVMASRSEPTKAAAPLNLQVPKVVQQPPMRMPVPASGQSVLMQAPTYLPPAANPTAQAPVKASEQSPVKASEPTPTVQLTAKAPEVIDPAKRVWAIQVGAFKGNEEAVDGAFEVREALKRAGMDDMPVLVGKGKGATFWKIYVAPCATFKEAEQVRAKLTPVFSADLFSTRLPKSLREAKN